MVSTLSPNIRAISTAADLELFLDVPQHVYANNPNWVPPLRSAIAFLGLSAITHRQKKSRFSTA
jgi:hypothetical protein